MLIALLLAAFFIPIVIYIVFFEPNLDVDIVTYDLDIEDWDDKPLRIGVLADPHVGLPNMSLKRFEHICDQLNAQNCDIIMLLGDYRARYLYQTTRYKLDDVAKIMTKLKAPLGVWGVLGNHDWWDDHDTMKRGYGPCISETIFRENGLQIMENENLVIDNRFNLVGLGDQWAFKDKSGFRGVHDLKKAMDGIQRKLPTIMMAHEPNIFSNLDEEVVLVISGHTHGGQVVINGKYIDPQNNFGDHIYGYYHENDRHLIVSGGLGTSVFPLRFGRPPELTLIDIAPRQKNTATS